MSAVLVTHMWPSLVFCRTSAPSLSPAGKTERISSIACSPPVTSLGTSMDGEQVVGDWGLQPKVGGWGGGRGAACSGWEGGVRNGGW